ncbi:RNA polymerase sigma factor SigM [Pseudonocardiaceae bacterium YIM PH 21723]|nr:RNA polymerase sigma factor SigM [Pseudonocardiaceae bacterium YIM PH 21723]
MTAPARSDAELMAAHAAGDPRAFSDLVNRHRDRMWTTALRTMRDQEEAADALQDAMVSAFRGAATFRAESQVSTWLHRIVVNACYDRLRKKMVRPAVSLEEATHVEPIVGDRTAERDMRFVVDAALRQLPDEQRGPIVLVDIEGYSVAETAQLLGIAEGTVKSRCSRGRLKLAKLLGHLRNQGEPGDVPPDTTPE